MLVDWEFTWQVLPLLAKASLVTVEATLLGFLFAATLGLLLAVLRMSRSRWITWPVGGFIEGVRSTPLLIQIYVMFFVLPNYGIMMPAFLTGVLALGLHYSTYCAEVYRAGLDNIPRSQWEASTALNFSLFHTYRYIIIPQAIPPVIPALGNYLVALFKETPLLSAIAIIEMMQQAKLIGAETFRYIEPVTLVGVFFLVFSIVSVAGIQRVEHWLKHRTR